jgi:hypothetical protein
MSNYHAIATVTASIKQILQNVKEDIAQVTITSKSPDAFDKTTNDTLNLFLYHITPNAAFRNSDLPGRDDRGLLVNKPRLALDLHYLLTSFATNEIRAQQILVCAMKALNANPIITKDTISKAIQSEPMIAGSDLGNQVDQVKITLHSLSSEELAAVWSSFSHGSYRTSVTYQASPVII